jgi:FG-GAP-like repeat
MNTSVFFRSTIPAVGLVVCAVFATSQVSPSNQFVEAPLVGNPFMDSVYATADFNRDGKPDLLVRNRTTPTQTLVVLLGNNKNQYVSKTVSDSATQKWDDPQVADMNGDGILDIVTASQGEWDNTGKFIGEGAIDIFFGKGDGTFRNHIRVADGQYTTPFLADVNRDGKPDLVVGTYPNGDSVNSGVQAFLNDGHGVLKPKPPLILNARGFETAIVAAGDITHKGSIDLITGPMGGKPYRIVTASADGSFHLGPTLPYSLPSPTFRSPVADYNGDGYLDYPLLDVRNGSIVMLLGSKSGTLAPAQVVYISLRDNLGQMATADFNGDGKPDLAFGYDAPDGVVAVYTGLGNGKLSNPRIYAERRWSGGMLAGDFNQDGKPDLIAGSTTLLLNDGKGNFPGPVLSQTGLDLPHSFVAGDFNRDGIPDVAVNTCSNRVSLVRVFTGTGNGFYNPQKSYPVAALGGLIVSGDLNHDGITDLVVIETDTSAIDCNSSYNPSLKMSVLLGKPDGTFAPSIDTNGPGRGPVGPQFSSSAYLADINSDGNLDLVGVWGVEFGNGNGTFRDGFSFMPGGGVSIRNLTVDDFNKDGYPDVAVCIFQDTGNPEVKSNFVRIFLNDGHGNLQMRSDIKLPYLVFGAKAVDLNGDGRLDMAITAYPYMSPPGGPALFVAKGNGDGTFGPVVSYADPNISVGSSIQTADFDRDGRADLVMVGYGKNSAGVVYFRGAGGGQLEAGTVYDVPLYGGIIVTDVDGINGPDILTLAGLGFTRLINTGKR